MTNMLLEQPSDPAAAVGERVRVLAWRAHINQTRLAAAIGVGQTTMSKKIRGLVPITVAELYALAGALEVAPADLLPRLDSNQQPSECASQQVSEGALRPRRLELVPPIPGQRPPSPHSYAAAPECPPLPSLVRRPRHLEAVSA